MHLMLYLSANKVAIFQPPHSIALFIEDLWPDYIMSSLYSAALSRNFALLPNSPSIRGPTPLYRLIFKVTWFFNSIFYRFYYILVYFLSSVSAFMPYFLPWVLFFLPRGFISINLFIHPPICVSVGAFNFINNWAQKEHQPVT